MRRADRLFQLIQLLRRGRVVTAQTLADRLSVSTRTVYRDIQDLTLTGVPIEGEAGVGYILRYKMDIPPLMFDKDELEALALGAQMVSAWGSSELAASATQALDKITAAIPDELKSKIEQSRMFAFQYYDNRKTSEMLEQVRQALNERMTMRIQYQRADGEVSKRLVDPLGLFFWGGAWTLVAWCKLREGYRQFRIDRIKAFALTGERYQESQGRSLNDYIEYQKNQCHEQ